MSVKVCIYSLLIAEIPGCNARIYAIANTFTEILLFYVKIRVYACRITSRRFSLFWRAFCC